MRVKDVVAEDFCNYKLPSLFIASAFCDWKCGAELCQNSDLAKSPTKDVSAETIYELYQSNDITKAIVIAGLEPMIQIDEVAHLISTFRERGDLVPFVIYTGYEPEEIPSELNMIKSFGNIIVKFGRYIPNQKPHFDALLGVNLASDNQRAIQIS